MTAKTVPINIIIESFLSTLTKLTFLTPHLKCTLCCPWEVCSYKTITVQLQHTSIMQYNSSLCEGGGIKKEAVFS